MKPYEKWPNWKGQEERDRACHRCRLDSKFVNDVIVMKCLKYTFHSTFMEINDVKVMFGNVYIDRSHGSFP